MSIVHRYDIDWCTLQLVHIFIACQIFCLGIMETCIVRTWRFGSVKATYVCTHVLLNMASDTNRSLAIPPMHISAAAVMPYLHTFKAARLV